jgi:hypothetical protein
MDALSLYSADYSTARKRFRQASARFGLQLQSHPIDERGPSGEELSIDVALSPGRSSDALLVLSSGIHGVEGFFGSAVQLAVLEHLYGQSGSLPPIRLLLLHGLNPFGFAWLRRFNEENVDLNRNFPLEGEAFKGSPPGYAALDGLLNPKRPPSAWEPFTAKALLTIARHGMRALKQAVAGGQYDFPKGLFFGGSRPSRTHELLTAHFEGWLGESREVVHLDFHTGLGAWASFKLFIHHPLRDGQRAKLIGWYGADAFETRDSPGIAFDPRGDFGRWCAARNPRRDYLFATAEFGTYSPIRVIAGLRAENQAHHWGKPGDRRTVRAKKRLKELFCPASRHWRSRVLEQSCRLVREAVDGLAAQR